MKFYVYFSWAGENDWAYLEPDYCAFDTYKEALDYVCKSMAKDEKAGVLGWYDYKISKIED